MREFATTAATGSRKLGQSCRHSLLCTCTALCPQKEGPFCPIYCRPFGRFVGRRRRRAAAASSPSLTRSLAPTAPPASAITPFATDNTAVRARRIQTAPFLGKQERFKCRHYSRNKLEKQAFPFVHVARVSLTMPVFALYVVMRDISRLHEKMTYVRL